MKTIAILCLSFLTLNSFGQVERHGNDVWIPVQQYKIIRNQVILCEDLKNDYDSLVISMDQSLLLKDSIILNQSHKIELKDSIIVSKDQTIKLLTKIPNNKFKISNQLWIGILSGLLTGIIIMK